MTPEAGWLIREELIVATILVIVGLVMVLLMHGIEKWMERHHLPRRRRHVAAQPTKHRHSGTGFGDG